MKGLKAIKINNLQKSVNSYVIFERLVIDAASGQSCNNLSLGWQKWSQIWAATNMSWIQNIYVVRTRRSNNRTEIPTRNAPQQGLKKQENPPDKDL